MGHPSCRRPGCTPKKLRAVSTAFEPGLPEAGDHEGQHHQGEEACRAVALQQQHPGKRDEDDLERQFGGTPAGARRI
jgi:hypothetical protein